ncbi:MAG: long-chain fatty acid--CoA ligase [Candidatus Omnitrophica bacterium]|nr:long-chain fatty acid--CoA ligase [Candidatus Omnitrophota bacterium]
MQKSKNIPEMFVAQAARRKGKTALKVKYEAAYRNILWDDLLNVVCDASLGFSQLGIRKDDKVAILSESRPEWIYTDLAILSLGAITVPIFPTYRQRDIDYIVKHSESRAIVISNVKQWGKIKQLKERYPELLMVVSFERIEGNEGVIPFDDIIKMGKSDRSKHKNVFLGKIRRIQEDDLATIIYTSGTTGPPKGVMLTHGNFLSNCEAAARAIPALEGSVALSALPLSHVFERLAGYYMYLYLGVIIAFAEGLNTLLENLKEIRPHIANFVPRIFEKFYHRLLGIVSRSSPIKRKLFYWALDVGKKRYVLQLKKRRLPFILMCAYALSKLLVYNKIRKQFGGRVKFFISGGAKLSRDIARFFYAADIRILEGYGLTETSPVISVNRTNNNKFGTVGIPLDNVEIKIAPDGEILVKGPSVMKGYYKDEEATRETIKDGWLYTGDIGVLDEQGFLKITDRKKDIIVTSGGKNVAPQNIENMLTVDQFINQVFICGDGEKYLSALIVPDLDQLEQFARQHQISYNSPSELISKKEMYRLMRERIERVNKELTDYEKIKKFALLSEEFSQDKGELTPTLKIKRNVIMTRYKNTINKLYGR